MPITVGNTAPTVSITFPPDGGFFNWGDQVDYTVTVTDPEDGDDRLRPGASCSTTWATTSTPTRCRASTGCTGTIQTSLDVRARRRRQRVRVFEATYTDDGGVGGSSPLTGRDIESAPAQAQAGRVLRGDRPGAGRRRRRRPRRAAGDHRRHPGRLPEHRLHRGRRLLDVRPGQPDRHHRPALPDGLGRSTAAGSRCAPARSTARCSATATVPGTGGWQSYVDVSATLTTTSDHDRAAVLRRPQPGRHPVGSCSTSTGSTSSAAASPTTRRRLVTASGDPDDRHRAARGRRSPARPPTRRATTRSPTPGTSVTARRLHIAKRRTPTPTPGTSRRR